VNIQTKQVRHVTRVMRPRCNEVLREWEDLAFGLIVRILSRFERLGNKIRDLGFACTSVDLLRIQLQFCVMTFICYITVN